MKLNILIVFLLSMQLFATEKFSIVKSIDDKVCTHVVNLLNNDIRDKGMIDLDQHNEFNWIKWKTYKKESESMYYLVHFDINNNQKDEAVFLYKSLFHFREIEDLYVVNNNDIESLKNDKNKLLLALEEKKIATVNNGFGVYTFDNSEKTVLLGKTRSYIVNAQLFPFQLNNQFYIVVFGNVESLSGDMPNDANVIVITRFNEKNKNHDICYIQRDLETPLPTNN